MNRPANVDVLLQPRPPSPLQEVRDAGFERHGVRLLLKRDDLVHPELPGNKWRKLAPNLRAAVDAGHDGLVTFGGAYSNHLRATAAAGRLLGLRTVGIVRGDELAGQPLNDSLARCAADGMRLHFVSRSEYRRKAEPQELARLVDAAGAGGAYVVPEGAATPSPCTAAPSSAVNCAAPPTWWQWPAAPAGPWRASRPGWPPSSGRSGSRSWQAVS